MNRLVYFLMIAVLCMTSFTSKAFAAIGIDRTANGYFAGKNRIGSLKAFGNDVMGNGFPNLALGIAFWGYGQLADKPHERYAGLAQVEAVVATGLTISLIKEVSKRKRPDGSDDLSFPSAHSGYAFATASVLGEFYGWKVGVPAYLLATATAVARLEDNRHWLTDVMVGGAIGTGFGLLFSKINKKTYKKYHEKSAPQPTVSAQPVVSPEFVGASLSLNF
jgi:membrane-associated phospholipid phosphatase